MGPASAENWSKASLNVGKSCEGKYGCKVKMGGKSADSTEDSTHDQGRIAASL